MTKHKIQNKSKAQISNYKTLVLVFVIGILNLFCHLNFDICHLSFAQEADLEFTLDVTSSTIKLPLIFKPNIDISGRGFYREHTWPQTLAHPKAIDTWQEDIGFNGIYRLQYNLWEIGQLAKDKSQQDSLLVNYENIIKTISDAGGIVILDIFGTPAGLGKVLDKRSPPWDLRIFKSLIKRHIKNLSCDKRYNIWYEVWSAPDLDEFFLGRKQEYLNLYRVVAESIKELREETKIHIPIGGPAVSWWFQNLDGNTIITPERSLIYELIKFCYRQRLPLDFISWHSYSTDPKVEIESTVYSKTAIALIREWLVYFNFDKNTPLIIDEWNYDRGENVLPERKEDAYICSSYIPARLKNMYKSGLDHQVYFSLEDFYNYKEGIIRNTGIFWFDPESSEYKGAPKSIYNVLKIFTLLGKDMFAAPLKFDNEFVGIIATKDAENITLLIYNYIDPDIAINFLSRNIASLNSAERRILLNFINTDKFNKLLLGQLEISNLRASNKVKTLLKKAKELNENATTASSKTRNIKISIKNLNGNFIFQRYTVDSSCSMDCKFSPLEEKEVSTADTYQEIITVNPYSVNMIILKPKPPEPKEPKVIPPLTNEQP